MKTLCTLVLALFSWMMVHSSKEEKNYYVKIATTQGTCILKLYNETPVHRDNFIKLVKAGYFNSTTFNRILKGFVIQGGDPDSLYEKNKVLKSEQKWLQPEFSPSLFHKRGVLAMGRDNNPEKKSFSTQIYIVDGKIYSEEQLVDIEKKYNIHFSDSQRQTYRTLGGTPFLDQNYTVFGEIVKGMDWIDKIKNLKVDKAGNPDKAVWMKIRVLTDREVGKELK